VSSDTGLSRPVLLSAAHDTSRFDCGKVSLSDFLQRFALENQKSGKSRTYAAARGDHVVAYYSLAPAGVAPLDVPVILLARLAVDAREQGAGLGCHMLLDALRRAVEGAEVVGGRAVLVHAKDDDARGFYERFGFERSPTDDLHLLMLIKDLRKTFGI
jgi:predicted N-acetyltransferase YhbS